MIQLASRLYTSPAPVGRGNFQPVRPNLEAKSQSQRATDGVILTISPEARRLQSQEQTNHVKTIKDANDQSRNQSKEGAPSSSKQNPDSTEALDPAEEQLLQRLKQNDLEVRIHERQHVAAAAGFVKGGPVYEYSTGPDGKKYAVAGHVSLDTSPVPNNPEATIRKAQVIKRAALAPADPSGADRAVAAAANSMELRAQKQLQEERSQQRENPDSQGVNLKVKAYTKPNYEPGQAVNLLV